MLASAKLKASTAQGLGKWKHDGTCLVTCTQTLMLQAPTEAIVDQISILCQCPANCFLLEECKSVSCMAHCVTLTNLQFRSRIETYICA